MNERELALVPCYIVLMSGKLQCSPITCVLRAHWSAVPKDHLDSARDGIWNETPIEIEITQNSERFSVVCLKERRLESEFGTAVMLSAATGGDPLQVFRGDAIYFRVHNLIVSRSLDENEAVVNQASDYVLIPS